MQPIQWLERAETVHTPFIEGQNVTFVWFGEQAPALYGDFNWWGIGGEPAAVMQRAQHGVWTYHLEVPPQTYIQYAYFADPDNPDTRLIDPFNLHPVGNGFGRFNNSFATVDYPPCCLPPRDAPLAGQVGLYEVADPHMLIGGKRRLWLYQPPTHEPVPLILAFDGQDAVHRGRLVRLVDALIQQGRIQPVALACLAHAEAHRVPEYNMSEALLRVITERVLPLAERTLCLRRGRNAHAVMGQSMGGLMALYTALRLPHVFGTVISQSGAFQAALDAPPAEMLPRLLWRQAAPLRIWLDVGRYEWLFTKNEAVQAELAEAGHEVIYRVYNSGHNWAAWHAILCDALTTLYGG